MIAGAFVLRFDLFYRICICCHDRNSPLMSHCEYMGPRVRCGIEYGLYWAPSSLATSCLGGGPPAAKCLGGGDNQMDSAFLLLVPTYCRIL